MQLISKLNKRIGFVLCVFDFFSKYACSAPLKDKKCITTTNAFKKISDELDRITNKCG